MQWENQTMKQYTFKDGIKVIASTKKEAITQHKVLSSNKKEAEETARKILQLLNNKNIHYSSGDFYINVPEHNKFYNTYETRKKFYMFGFDYGDDDHTFYLSDENEAITIDWREKGMESKILNFCHRIINKYRKEMEKEIRALTDLHKLL